MLMFLIIFWFYHLCLELTPRESRLVLGKGAPNSQMQKSSLLRLISTPDKRSLLPSSPAQRSLLPSGSAQRSLLPSGSAQRSLLSSGSAQRSLLSSSSGSVQRSRLSSSPSTGPRFRPSSSVSISSLPSSPSTSAFRFVNKSTAFCEQTNNIKGLSEFQYYKVIKNPCFFERVEHNS